MLLSNIRRRIAAATEFAVFALVTAPAYAAGSRDVGSRGRKRGRVSLDSHHLARRANEPRHQQCDVGDA
jgi:hypothetical protein